MADVQRELSSDTFDTTVIRQRAVKTLVDNLVIAEFGTPGILPANSGSTLRWHIDTNLVSGTGSATDSLIQDDAEDPGVPITYSSRDTYNEDVFAGTGIPAQLQVYGTFLPMRTADLKFMPRTMLERIGDRVAYRAADTIDTLCRAALDGTGAAFDPGMGAGTTTTRKSNAAGGAAALAAGDILTLEEIILTRGDLRALNAMEYDDNTFKLIIHSIAETDLVTDVVSTRVNWIDSHRQAGGVSGQEKVVRGDVGTVMGVQVIVSNKIATATQDVDAHHNIMLSKDALGVTHMGDMKPDVFINKPDSGSTDNPHRMFSTIAWQAMFVPVLLDSNRAALLFTENI